PGPAVPGSPTHASGEAGAPVRSTRPWVRPPLDSSRVPTGTFSLHTYFTALGPRTLECGTATYTASALSFLDDCRSSPPLGNPRGPPDRARVGYFGTPQPAVSRPAWMPVPLASACRKRWGPSA